jgi:hypothetical protein
VGGFNRNENQIVVTEQERGGNGPVKAPSGPELETPDLHRFPADSGAGTEGGEVRTLEVVDYGRGANVRLPSSDLEAAGFDPPDHNTVVRLGLKEVKSEDIETVFARYNTKDHRAEAYVGDIGGAKGSRYELVEARGVDEGRLVKEFERGKCEHLENVRLEHSGGKMFLNVDERRVELEDYRISTGGSHAMVRGKLEGREGCKIEFDGRKAVVLFGRDYHVEEMKMQGDSLVVGYAQSRNAKYEHRMHLEHLEAPERPSLNQFSDSKMLSHVEMFERPEKAEGTYHFILDRTSQAEIRALLEDAGERGDRAYGMMKAEISERLVPNILESAGWERVKWHPFNNSGKEGADAPGTDWLVRTPDGKAVLMEVKWFENQRDGAKKAAAQVRDDFEENKERLDVEITGAYIAIVGYDEDNKDGKTFRITVLRVLDLENLR